MLRNVSEIFNYQLMAKDGEIGKCKDFLFDDEQWAVRYMVADTSRWLPGRKVLISPLSIGAPDWFDRLIPVDLTKEKIKSSPPLEEDAPVSRQYEAAWADYFSYPYYWPQESLWGIDHYVMAKKKLKKSNIEDPQESNLRSVKEVKGYELAALDGKFGHIDDFIIEDNAWSIRYLVVDTRVILPGEKKLISPVWIEDVHWAGKRVLVNKKREIIEKSPKYDPNQPVNLEYEARLYDYYGRPLS